MDHPIGELMQTAMSSIKDMVDVNTVIGDPVVATSGATIIPISKVSMAYATGGLDYAGKSDPNKDPKNFGAGGGTGLTMQPLGFLIVDKDGNVDMINVGVKNPSDPIEQISDLLERSPEIIAKVKALLGKDKPTDKGKDKDE